MMAGPHFSWLELFVRLGCALVFGAAIGAERQYRQRTAGLRTYSLVAVGAALFILLAPLTGVQAEGTRIAAQVISGVGFLGAGVLMRTGLSVHGLNTASTIWCSAAVGVLAGSGFYAAAFLGTLFVLSINIFLRPLAHWVGRYSKDKGEHEVSYSFRLLCRNRQESRVRTLLIQLVGSSPLLLQEIESAVGTDDKLTVIKAVLSATERSDAQVEQIASRLTLERDIVGVSWNALPSTSVE
jgi:putative Mg2+ transporter-C (MgtC) family protein